jgi:hypothetical protein
MSASHLCELKPVRSLISAHFVSATRLADTISKIKKGDMHASEHTGAQRSCQ